MATALPLRSLNSKLLMAVFALVTGGARGEREAALIRAARRLGSRARAGAQLHHMQSWSLWVGAVQERERASVVFVSAGGVSAIFDGWMRNARELAKHCDLPADADPAPIIHALLQREGVAGLSRLRGGYAALLIDEHAGTVLLARDPTGMSGCGLSAA